MMGRTLAFLRGFEPFPPDEDIAVHGIHRA